MWRASSRELIGNPGVGGGELSVDDGLVSLRRVELVADLVPLAEGVTDEPRGALVEGVEVLRQVGVVIPAKIKNWLRSRQSYIIGLG